MCELTSRTWYRTDVSVATLFTGVSFFAGTCWCVQCGWTCTHICYHKIAFCHSKSNGTIQWILIGKRFRASQLKVLKAIEQSNSENVSASQSNVSGAERNIQWKGITCDNQIAISGGIQLEWLNNAGPKAADGFLLYSDHKYTYTRYRHHHTTTMICQGVNTCVFIHS